MVDFKADERLNTLNHSCAHVMAQAVKHLYPQAKFWVGPVVTEGFYYDIDLGDDVISDEAYRSNRKRNEESLQRRQEDYPDVRFPKQKQWKCSKMILYKLDLIRRSGRWKYLLLYDQGDFTDLCRGPHVDNAKLCKTLQTGKTFRCILER